MERWAVGLGTAKVFLLVFTNTTSKGSTSGTLRRREWQGQGKITTAELRDTKRWGGEEIRTPRMGEGCALAERVAHNRQVKKQTQTWGHEKTKGWHYRKLWILLQTKQHTWDVNGQEPDTADLLPKLFSLWLIFSNAQAKNLEVIRYTNTSCLSYQTPLQVLSTTIFRFSLLKLLSCTTAKALFSWSTDWLTAHHRPIPARPTLHDKTRSHLLLAPNSL